MLLAIRNMVCHRCRLSVEAILADLGLHPRAIRLGEVDLEETALTPEQRAALEARLQAVGFELLDDRRRQLIERIKTCIIETVRSEDGPPSFKYSVLLSETLGHDYTYLSHLFSATEGLTIEQFILQQKIERVKELLIYGEQNLSQIALDMGYSSTAHLSAQFRKLTGITPTEFRRLGAAARSSIQK